MSRRPASLDEVLAVLRARRDELRDRCKVEVYGVVGSLARGEAHADSDVDVLSLWMEGTTLFKVADASLLLEDQLGRDVQLINSKMLKPDMRARMEADLVRV